ncbi:MAG: PorV/PorQ family protein [Candidatus Eisenbacteria bacterium]|nr:PorV/PorQ family protein [Candidatus Eisenbacteria bacterium]
MRNRTQLQRPAVAAAVALLLAALALAPTAALSQVSLGGQRVGTTSGTFLKLPLSAPGAAMAGAYVAVVDDVTSVGWNPAGLATVAQKGFSVTHIQWFADVDYTFGAYAQPWEAFNGSVGVFFGSLSTTMDETTEYMPYGTGRKFAFTDWLAGVTLARRLTDKLMVGANVKYVREELGTDVGGPVTNSWLLDIGTKYYVGLSSIRMAMYFSNFGPEMKPSGTFVGLLDGSRIEQDYEGFAPPTVFKFGIAFDPVKNEMHRLTAAAEMNHYADNEETIRAGAEYELADVAFLRGGYDMNSDDMGPAFGVGLKVKYAGINGTIDYSYMKGEYLGNVNIFTLNFAF